MFDVAGLRDEFPLLQAGSGQAPIVYLDNAATSLKPRAVIEAVRGYLADYSGNVHRGQNALADRASQAYEDSRRSVARFLGARASEVVFVRGATEAVNLVAGGLALAPDDNVVVSLLEHHSNSLPWRARCQVRVVPLAPSGLPDLAAAEAAIDARTRLVAITACSNVTGVYVPMQAWSALAHRHGLPLLVDAAQLAAHRGIDVQSLQCDYLALSGHKLFGPPGSGVLYGTRAALERLTPLNLGGGCVTHVGLDLDYELRELPWRLEAGTPDIAAVIGLGAAVEFIEDIGIDAIALHEEHLRDVLDAEIAAMPELHNHSPSDARAPILTVTARDPAIGSEYIARVLSDTFGIMTRAGHHCAHPLHAALGLPATLRASLAFYNTEDELLRLRDALRALLRRGARG
ncbi:aminotransferase class V-fold PLP-dependent enzyme [Nannocystis radixulma]|uniref:cysteine desulfurase n=1 Tax=Nannocystis radixulma TaxID=2995305 RepID=A0ABT5B214_9BACT|nr:cysteine desulfurase [Nannocystis radixulma]MDC0668141.1 cysteine desulfurase [Nannocystis radixulma]